MSPIERQQAERKYRAMLTVEPQTNRDYYERMLLSAQLNNCDAAAQVWEGMILADAVQSWLDDCEEENPRG